MVELYAREASWAPSPNRLSGWLGVPVLDRPTTSAFAVVVNSDHQVLVVNVRSRGWDLPGGRLDVDESPVKAVSREVAEETGVRIPKKKFKPFGWLQLDLLAEPPVDYLYPREGSLMQMFTATLTEKHSSLNPAKPLQLKTAVPDEISDVAFVSLTELVQVCAARDWWPLVQVYLEQTYH